ncbi:NAD-dependent epimerase/dehydratase family protein [Archangium minus]|uniref:NAD-dependent epimerase/dehydratase family protein n=1 Tax=Archangium minus TaxID=83450 RepID=A0ABY9WYP6_9BACT|nr:NAD-dependent epimerase/dehydratase family protein [Archangium violaceum]WNG48257.1 NAD-dependent epimerase/dehydratase family protein [Archangium minus]
MVPLILLGCGYTLTRLAREEARKGRRVLAVTRDEQRREELSREGVQLLSLEEAVASSKEAHVVISIPPDAGLDASLAESLERTGPSCLVYLSSTGVYGGARGHVDEDTPVDPTSANGRGRIEAEARYRRLGGIALRIAGIYGPGRGLHERLRAGTLRIPESGGGRISRVHVDDLVQAIQVVLEKGELGGWYCVADDRPATQAETSAWLCARMGLPPPPAVPLASLHESLRGDRAVSNARLKALGWRPRYPDFVAGFSALLDAGT